MIEVLNEIKNKMKEDVTQEEFKTFLDSIELTDVEKGRQAYREFKNNCKEVGMGNVENKEIIDEVEARVDEAINQLSIIKKAITEKNRTPIIGQGFVNMFKSATVNVQNHLAEASNGLNQIEITYCDLCEEVEVYGVESVCKTCQDRLDDCHKEDFDKLNEIN